MDGRAALLQVASRWYAQRPRLDPGALPDVRSLDPRDFPTLMPWCLLVAIEPVLMESRIIICGTGVVRVVHEDWTGRRLRDISLGAVGNQIFEPFTRTIEAREPVLVRERRRGNGDRWRSNDRLMLPYTVGGSRRVERLLSITLFDKATDMLSWPTSIDAWEVVESNPAAILLGLPG